MISYIKLEIFFFFESLIIRLIEPNKGKELSKHILYFVILIFF